jgi:hypothetical protein
MAKTDSIKMAIVAGASYAMKYKEQNPHASESEVMSHVTQNISKILSDIED